MTSILANNVEISKTLCCAEGQTRSLAGICGTTCCSHGLTNRSHRNTNKCQNTNTYATQTGLTKTQTCIKNTHKHKQVFQKGKGVTALFKNSDSVQIGAIFHGNIHSSKTIHIFSMSHVNTVKKLFFSSCISRTFLFYKVNYNDVAPILCPTKERPFLSTQINS